MYVSMHMCTHIYLVSKEKAEKDVDIFCEKIEQQFPEHNFWIDLSVK